MPSNENEMKQKGYPERVQRDGIKLIHGKCEPLYQFDLRETHDSQTGQPCPPPKGKR